MAYSLLIQQTMDLDLFLRDSEKYIHIASGGGQLPTVLAENDVENDIIAALIEELPEDFEIEINQDLGRLLNLNQNQLENYLSDFLRMARKGFHSYDKSNLGDFGNVNFHLVARPKKNQTINFYPNEKFLISKINFPNHFRTFSLFNCFGQNKP